MNNSDLNTEILINQKGGEFSLFKDLLKLEILPETFGTGKRATKLVASLVSPLNRGKLAPPLKEHERLVSEIFYISCNKLTGALPSPIKVTFTYLTNLKLHTPTETLKPYIQWKGSNQWDLLTDAQHDQSKKQYSFEINHAPATGVYICVLSSPKVEKFEITPNGTFYTSRLNHNLSIRIQRGSIPINSTCSIRIFRSPRVRLEQAKTEKAKELSDLQDNFVSDFYDFQLVDSTNPDQPNLELQNYEFRRPIQIKVPVPEWYQESQHPSELLTVLYKVRENEWNRSNENSCWEVAEEQHVKYNKLFISFETRVLTRFCVCLAKEANRTSRLNTCIPIVEDYCTSFPADWLVCSKFNKNDWTGRISLPKDSDQKEKLKEQQVGTEQFTYIERQRPKLITRNIRDEDSSSIIDDGSYQAQMQARLRKKYKKTVHFIPQQFPQRIKPGSTVQITVSGAVTTGSNENDTCEFGLYEDFPDFQHIFDMRPRSDIESFVRDLLEKEQDRLNKIARNELFEEEEEEELQQHQQESEEQLSDTEVQISNTDTEIAENTDSDENEEYEEKRPVPRKSLDLNAIEFKSQITITIINPDSSIDEIKEKKNNTVQNLLDQYKNDPLTATYEFTISLHQVREYLNLPIPVPPEPEPVKQEVEVAQSALNEPTKKKLTASHEDLLKRIEQQAEEMMKNGGKMQARWSEGDIGKLVGKDNAGPLLALRRTMRTNQLAKPKQAYANISATQFSREPKVLSGRSLQWLSKHVERGLTLGVHLQLKDSVVSGIAFDSLSKRSALNEVTYRVLLQWKRYANPDSVGTGSGSIAGGPIGQTNTLSLNGVSIAASKAARMDGMVQQLISALRAMELHELANAVSYAAEKDLELTDLNMNDFVNRSSPELKLVKNERQEACGPKDVKAKQLLTFETIWPIDAQ